MCAAWRDGCDCDQRKSRQTGRFYFMSPPWRPNCGFQITECQINQGNQGLLIFHVHLHLDFKHLFESFWPSFDRLIRLVQCWVDWLFDWLFDWFMSTSLFFFSRFWLEIQYFSIQNVGEMTDHHPEVVLTNFTTRLGHTVGRMFAALFPHDPNFHGRRAMTFHNQRDFIFFRNHR